MVVTPDVLTFLNKIKLHTQVSLKLVCVWYKNISLIKEKLTLTGSVEAEKSDVIQDIKFFICPSIDTKGARTSRNPFIWKQKHLK